MILTGARNNMTQLTKKAIMNSFILLLNKRPLDQITVTDIANQCGISRRTFYNYYQDIYQIPEELFSKETENILKDQSDHNSWEAWFLKIMGTAYEHKIAVIHLYNSVRREYLERCVYNVTGRMMRDYIRRLAESSPCNQEDIDLLASFYTNAVVGMVLDWIKEGMREDPEKTIRKTACLMKGTIDHALNNCIESSALHRSDHFMF